jgi:hypothetical protein
MSVTGIPSSVSWPEFQQLGQNLQSGNLTAAQADFVTLQQDASVTLNATSSSSSSDSVAAQSFRQLAQDLQSERLSDTTQKGIDGASQNLGTEISQLFAQLGQELQAGNLFPAQHTYIALEQYLRQLGENLATPTDPTTTGVSFSA